jgi:hypothetical protein
MSSLIPLQYGAKKCILVGDPNQLPPTVLSQHAQEFLYEQSLFQRVMNCNSSAVHLLRYVLCPFLYKMFENFHAYLVYNIVCILLFVSFLRISFILLAYKMVPIC